MRTLAKVALVMGFGITTSIWAADKPKDAKPEPAKSYSSNRLRTVPPNQTKQGASVVVTGSLIPRPINRNGFITDGPDPLYVVDNKFIQTSGAADLRQVLVKGGFGR